MSVLKKIKAWLNPVKSNKKKFFNRAPRLAARSLTNIHFIERQSALPMAIANLSTTGVGLVNNGDLKLALNGVLQGTFYLNGKEITASMRIIRIENNLVGCHFEVNYNELKNQIEQYFRIELSALKMVRVNPEILQEQPDGKAEWFKGQNNAELFLVKNANQIIRFHLAFFGNYIEGQLAKPLKFGVIVTDDGSEKMKYKGSSLIQWQSQGSDSLRVEAKQFIQHIELLTDLERSELTKYLESSIQSR